MRKVISSLERFGLVVGCNLALGKGRWDGFDDHNRVYLISFNFPQGCCMVQSSSCRGTQEIAWENQK